jgi:hypothetical protein
MDETFQFLIRHAYSVLFLWIILHVTERSHQRPCGAAVETPRHRQSASSRRAVSGAWFERGFPVEGGKVLR